MKALLLAALCAVCVSAAPSLPDRPASGRILDQTGSLSDAGKARIQGVSDELESRTGAQLAVAVVKTLDGLDPADYANRLFRAWGVGRKGKDDGALILICPAERKSRIEVGYGLEGQLPDALAGRILKDELRPYFQDGKFEDGILFGARRIEEIVSGKPASGAPPPRPRRSSAGGSPPVWFMVPFFSLFVLMGGAAVGSAFAAFGVGGAAFFLLIWGGMFSGIPLLMAKLSIPGFGFAFLLAEWVVALAWAFVWGRNHPDTLKMKGGGSGGGFWSSGGGWGSGGGGDFGGGGGSDFGGGSSGGGGASDSW